MNKLKTYGAVAGGVVMIACWPLVVGQIGEKLVSENIGRASNSDVKVEVVDYDRGYLSSQIQLKLSLVQEGLKEKFEQQGWKTDLYLNTEVKHGLFSVDSLTTLRDYPELPLSISSHSQLNGDTHFIAKLEEYKHEIAGTENETIAIAASELNADVTLDKQVKLSLNMPSLEISNDLGEQVKLTKLMASADGQIKNHLWIGQQTMDLESAEAISAENEMVSLLEGFSYQLVSSSVAHSLQNEASSAGGGRAQFDSESKIRLKKAVIAEQQLDDIQLDLHAGEVDKQSLEDLLHVVQTQNLEQEENLQNWFDQIDKLFSYGFVFNIEKIGFSYLNQPVSAKLAFRFPEGEPHITQNPMLFVSKLNGDVNAQMPKALVDQVPNLKIGIDQLQAGEYITQTESGFLFSVKVEDGNLLFSNGQKMPIITALMPLFMR